MMTAKITKTVSIRKDKQKLLLKAQEKKRRMKSLFDGSSSEEESSEQSSKKLKVDWALLDLGNSSYSDPCFSDGEESKTEEPDIYSNSCLNMIKTTKKVDVPALKKPEPRRVVPTVLQWDKKMEVIQMPEKISWLKTDSIDKKFYAKAGNNWLQRGIKKSSIDDETKFCDESILAKILVAKKEFNNFSAQELRVAQTKCNPFETIRNNIFMNRAAVKMANIDTLLDQMFTNPVDQNGNSMVNDNDLLYFADVCAGPGGFSEYVLWRKGWLAKGYGFTLKGENDFKIDDFLAGHPESFHPYYGAKNDGNVCDPENIKSLTKLVMEETDVGVHFMMADGGCVEGKENIEEILSKQLYLAQCLVALSIVRPNGHFMVKLFGVFTSFSVGLIYLMSKCFEEITIFKPNSSRSDSSERYLVCKWKKSNVEDIRRYLSEVNQEMWTKKSTKKDISELVPLDVIQADKKFNDYIVSSNNTIGMIQIAGLLKASAYCNDKNLFDNRQSSIRKNCLQLWKIPDQLRTKTQVKKASYQMCSGLMGEQWNKEKFMGAAEKRLERAEKLETIIHSVHDYYFVGVDAVENDGTRTWFMSKGNYDVVQYNSKKNLWEPVTNLSVRMSTDTLIYGEIVKEFITTNGSQSVVNSLHIIDAIVLGGVVIKQLALTERNQLCQSFAKSHQKPALCNSPSIFDIIRCKPLYKLAEMESFLKSLAPRTMKNKLLEMTIETSIDKKMFHIPHGLLLMSEVRSDKMKCFSASKNRFYYFDKNTKKATYPEKLTAADMFASTKNTFTTRLIWTWTCKEQTLETFDHIKKEKSLLYREDFEKFIKQLVNKNIVKK